MAWTNIPNANLAAGAPIRSVDLLAIRDNIPAVANGDSGAPKVQTNGINDSAVTTAKLATNEQMNTTNVLNSTAGLTAGAVGSYAFLGYNDGGGQSFGSTRAGSSLRPAGCYYNSDTVTFFPATFSTTVAGTWRCLGFQPSSPSFTSQITVWLRIS